MRALRWIAALLPAVAVAGWLPAGTFHVPDGTGDGTGVVFINPGAGYHLPSNQWVSVDVTSVGIPVEATAVAVQGTLIITHGTASETCDLQIYIRKPGSSYTSAGAFGQVVETQVGGGQRSPWTFIIPVEDGRFDFWWQVSTGGSWPANCAYAVNLKAAGYWR